MDEFYIQANVTPVPVLEIVHLNRTHLLCFSVQEKVMLLHNEPQIIIAMSFVLLALILTDDKWQPDSLNVGSWCSCMVEYTYSYARRFLDRCKYILFISLVFCMVMSMW